MFKIVSAFNGDLVSLAACMPTASTNSVFDVILEFLYPILRIIGKLVYLKKKF